MFANVLLPGVFDVIEKTLIVCIKMNGVDKYEQIGKLTFF